MLICCALHMTVHGISIEIINFFLQIDGIIILVMSNFV